MTKGERMTIKTLIVSIGLLALSTQLNGQKQEIISTKKNTTKNKKTGSSITAENLLEEVDSLYRLQKSYSRLTMEIKTPEWTRKIDLEAWSLKEEYTLLRLLSPKKDKGISTLRIKKDMWNYFPKIDKQMKIPPSMMMGDWMGSDFTNDDLVKQTYLKESYSVSLTTDKKNHLLLLKPHKETATVWGKIEIVIDKETRIPKEQRYYDEKNQLIRTMQFLDVTNFGNKKLPAKLVMIPHKKPNHQTTITYQSIDFSVDIKESFFSFRNLKKK